MQIPDPEMTQHSSQSMTNVLLNGETTAVAHGMSIAALLLQRSLSGKRVAVERNGEIVPKSRHGEVLLSEGDRLEIVVAVGGG